VEIEFEHDVGAMGFGGVDADVEEVGYFLVAFAFGEELKDFAFAGSEAGARGSGGIGRIGNVGGFGNADGEIRLVLAEGLEGVEEDAVGVILEDVAVSAGFDDLLNEVVGLVHGENEDFGGGRSFADLASCFHAVEERHADVEDGDVRFVFGGFFDGVAAVDSFGANFPAAAGLDERAQAGADDGVIVGDEDVKRVHAELPGAPVR